MHHPTDMMAHTTAFVTPVVEHWLEREIAQWVHHMKDRSDDPSHHERTPLLLSYISLLYLTVVQSTTSVRFNHNRLGPFWHGSVLATIRSVCTVYVLFLTSIHHGIPLGVNFFFIAETITQILYQGSINDCIIYDK